MLKHTDGRIIVKVDIEQKNHYSFSNGMVIRLERDYNNFDRKYTSQVLGTVVDAEYIPTDSFILFHHNSLHETYQIFNHSNLSGEEIASGIKMFSIMERDVFLYKEQNSDEWKPTKGYATALRVFEPYLGIIEGISPKQLKDTLWVTSGEYKDMAVKTLPACDYMITFRCPETGRDKNIIRFRPDRNEKEQREPEAIAILNEVTQKIKEGKYLVGINTSDCLSIKKEIYAD